MASFFVKDRKPKIGEAVKFQGYMSLVCKNPFPHGKTKLDIGWLLRNHKNDWYWREMSNYDLYEINLPQKINESPH